MVVDMMAETPLPTDGEIQALRDLKARTTKAHEEGA